MSNNEQAATAVQTAGRDDRSTWQVLEDREGNFTLRVQVRSTERPRVSYLWEGEINISHNGTGHVGAMRIAGIDEDDEREPEAREMGVTQQESNTHVGMELGTYPSRRDGMPLEESIPWVAELCFRRSRELEQSAISLEEERMREERSRSQTAQTLREMAEAGPQELAGTLEEKTA